MSYLGIALCGTQVNTPLPGHKENHTEPYVTMACKGVNAWFNNPISPPKMDVASIYI